MKLRIGVVVIWALLWGMLGGCAAHRVADGDHVAPFAPAGVAYRFRNAAPLPGKTPLVFVHGWACDHRYWASAIEGLPRDRAMLAVDLPGYGMTPDGGAEHTMDLYADAVIAAMDDAGIDRAALLGHSMGTPVVRQVYRRHPGRVAGLVAVDGALQPMASGAQMMEVAAPLFTDEWRSFATTMFDGMSSTMAREADRAHVREVMLATPMRSMRGGFTAMFDDRVWNDDPIGAPVLAVVTDSPMWSEGYRDSVRLVAPGVRFVVIPGASHFLMMDDPVGFDRAVEAWLDDEGL
jgi:pimeloyl-ACP methyl ester carboxylesterase